MALKYKIIKYSTLGHVGLGQKWDQSSCVKSAPVYYTW